ncbi:oxidoreductase [Klebsiella pneumoniae]|uniref:Oxidoreductase n=1 Tax=Klebsiella pneumoniae TaxID=573 RepID=A0A378F8L6_KLEPN|nr:oxidoreductase [Klebsiella pneumoniae]
MSNSDIRVVPGPANYFSHPGSLERLSDFFSADQLSRAVWVYGERALAGAEPFLPAAFHLPEAKKIPLYRPLQRTRRGGAGAGLKVTTRAVVDWRRRRRAARQRESAGPPPGGTAWWPSRLSPPPARLGRRCRCGIGDAGQALNFEIFDDANFLVLVEPRIILNAPAEYLLAGIGDTLAKWYEAVVLAPQPEALPLTVRLGINGALAIRDVLLASSETALADQRRGDLTQAFRDVVEAIIAGGGMVGGLGERYTRVAPPMRCTTD